MAAITSTTESWNGHSFSEVESHIKSNYSSESKAAVAGGADLSLVTTGEKYDWTHHNIKQYGTLYNADANDYKDEFCAALFSAGCTNTPNNQWVQLLSFPTGYGCLQIATEYSTTTNEISLYYRVYDVGSAAWRGWHKLSPYCNGGITTQYQLDNINISGWYDVLGLQDGPDWLSYGQVNHIAGPWYTYQHFYGTTTYKVHKARYKNGPTASWSEWFDVGK